MKGISVVLILAICMGNIFCHIPEVAAATKRITMTSLYNNGDCLPVEEGDTVTIESLEEWNMFADYSAEGYDMQGVTVELLNDIQASPYTFFFDEETMLIGISWYGSFEAAYDANSQKYYENFGSGKIIKYQWHDVTNVLTVEYFNGIFEGNGHYISGVCKDTGLFEKIKDGQVRNLNLSQFFLSRWLDGALCKEFSGEIVNCHGSDIFSFKSTVVGGLVGQITRRGKTFVADCSAEVHMSSEDKGGGMIGLIGDGVEVMVERCHTSGFIYGAEDAPADIGGIVGYISEDATVEIRNCVSEVNIAGSIRYAGGIAGWNGNATCLFNCENRGNISSVHEKAEVGGLIGIGSYQGITVIDRCRNTGKIRSPYTAGGIAGNTRGIEIRNTENVGDVCFEVQSDVSKHDLGGIGGIIGRVENMETIGGCNSIVGIKNSFCSGNVNGGENYAGGLIGAIKSLWGSRVVCDLGIDNVCVYGEVGAGAEDAAGIILGGVVNADVESFSVEGVYYREQKTSPVSGDRTELPACMYPVSEAQMSGTEEDTYIGQGDFAQTTSLCDALNRWCRAQDESAGMIGWKQGEVFPVLEMDETAKPEKPEFVLPTFMPTQKPTPKPTIYPTEEPMPEPTEEPTQAPVQIPIETPTQNPTPTPTSEPTGTPTLKPTETPTQKPTETPTLRPTLKPTLKPTETPTLRPTLKPTLKPTETPTQKPTGKPTEEPTQKPTEKPTETPTQSPAPIALPTVTPLPAVSPPATLLPAASGKPVVKPTPPKTDTKKKKMKAPVFSLKKKRTASGKRYVSIRLKQYQGTYAEIWAGRRKKGSKKLIYSKLKIKKNNIRRVKGVFNFLYAKQKGILVFRIRTYSKKGKKRVYSYKSKGKRIRLT